MPTGPGPDAWMDDPRYWAEQDRFDREYEEAVKRGDIKIPWWSNVLLAILGIVFWIILLPFLAFEDLVDKIKSAKRRPPLREEDE